MDITELEALALLNDRQIKLLVKIPAFEAWNIDLAAQSCYWSYQWFDVQTRRKGQFCFVLTRSSRLYAFLNKGIFDRRLNCNKSH